MCRYVARGLRDDGTGARRGRHAPGRATRDRQMCAYAADALLLLPASAPLHMRLFAIYIDPPTLKLLLYASALS